MNSQTSRQVGSYLLLTLLGQGDYSEVYLAEHYRSKERVALKILNPHLSDTLDRIFADAARTMAQLDHPHIVRILDLGMEAHAVNEQQNHFLYFAMSYALHGSIRQRYQQGVPAPLRAIVNDVQHIAEALHFAHSQGILHQDLKPENILVGANNEILLSDFGFSDSDFLTTQASPSSVLYTAPEQMQGRPSIASDQYALGAIVYEWISGAPPFTGSTKEIVEQHLSSKPLPFQEKGLRLPLGIEQVVMRALEKDPQKRFPNITSFATALERASLAEGSY
jgi:serine/threonine protein kinase